MMSTSLLTALLASTASVLAAPFPILTASTSLTFTMDAPVDNHVGKPVTMTWGGATGAVDIMLMSGTARDLKTVGTIAAGLWSGTATYIPEAEGMYAFEIIDGSGNVNYSPLFWVGP